MIIVHVGSEVVPFSKTGGLADVLGSLPLSIAERGNEVIIISPLYKSVTEKIDFRKQDMKFSLNINGENVYAKVYSKKINKYVTAYFIGNDSFFLRDGLYVDENGIDYKDNAKRFIFFSRAAIELIQHLNIMPDVVHSHDWHTGLIPAYMKTLNKNKFSSAISVFTIHNMGYRGMFPRSDMAMTGLGWEYYTSDFLKFYGKISLLKAGIVFADAVTTVSPTYSEEILTSEFGYGMSGILRARRSDLFGILNGVDYEQWSPEIDRYIPRKYTVDAIEFKHDSKTALNRMLNLDDSDAPIMGIVTRLTRQKGIDLIIEAVSRIISMGFKFVLLGSGDKSYEEKIRKLADRYKRRCSVKIGFDNSLAHLIEAGADMYVMPSLYEPCGLNQMYSLKYGTVPIVRATGGLNDTIVEYEPSAEKGNGFRFRGQSADEMLSAIKKAGDVYHDKGKWQRLVRNCMSYDFSWSKSTEDYELLYKVYIMKSYLHGYRSSIT